jgi:hypothetical protein
MKSIENALTDVVSMYKQSRIEYEVLSRTDDETVWTVNVYNRSATGSFLQIEVIDDDGVPKCCVLQKVNVGRKSMFQFMNRLVDALDE